MPLFRQAPLGRRNGSPETRSFAGGGALLRKSENTRGCTDRQRSDRSAAMHLLQCNMNPVLSFGHYGRDVAFLVFGSKPRTKSITLAEDISHGFSIDLDPANR